MFGNLQDGESSSATAEWMSAVRHPRVHRPLIDLPGVDPKAVDVTLDNGVLTLAGERRDERSTRGDEQEELQQHRVERRLGRFHRRFILPDTVDTENVSATGRNGVLEISIAKHAKAQPRRITIK